jgi:hypothetical protein
LVFVNLVAVTFGFCNQRADYRGADKHSPTHQK